MDISFFALIFLSAIGILGVLFCLHFRYRSLAMGPQRLRNALSRTVSGEENASEEDLGEGLLELESRLRRAIVATSLLLLAVLASCIILAVVSAPPWLTTSLSGVCVLLAAVISSLLLLRDIPRFLRRRLEEETGYIEDEDH